MLLEKCSRLTNKHHEDQLTAVSISAARRLQSVPIQHMACSLLDSIIRCMQWLQDGPYEKLYLAHETDASECGPYVTLSLHGRNHSMTVQEISAMPVAEFAFLWTVHTRAPASPVCRA